MNNASSAKKKIAAFVPNVLDFSPGQRVRIELWERYLKEAGWDVEFFPFENAALHEVLYEKGNSFDKAGRIIQCYQEQLSRVLTKISADVLFIYREAALVGPALIERLAARQKIPIVYDIDDPVFLPYRSPANGWASLLKFSKKTHKLFQISDRVIAINKLIGDYAGQYNRDVTVIPNCIDTEKYRVRADRKTDSPENKTRLVWIGSHSTMPNLLSIVEPLKKLQDQNKTTVLVIGAGQVNLEGVEAEFRQWSEQTEVSDLQEGDVGLLPLNDLEWNNWKFFFKTIQYMAVGIPVVARRMGSNSEVIQDGVNGFLVETMNEWYEKLDLLVSNPELRIKMGEAARQTVLENYSLKTQMPRVVKVFENAADERGKKRRKRFSMQTS